MPSTIGEVFLSRKLEVPPTSCHFERLVSLHYSVLASVCISDEWLFPIKISILYCVKRFRPRVICLPGEKWLCF